MNTNPVGALDRKAMAAARAHWDGLIKPPQGLGSLEEFVIHLAGITGSARPSLLRRRALVMVAEHGVAEAGVSAYPPGMTREIVKAFLEEKSGTAVLGRETRTEVHLIDVGLKDDCGPKGSLFAMPDRDRSVTTLRCRKIAPGTGNFLRERAMSREQVFQALQTGSSLVREAVRDGVQGLALGEIGIGNTTACSAITAALLELPPAEVVGRGSGLSPASMEKKRLVIEEALALHRPPAGDVIEVLSMVGGLEIAALAGAILEAARCRTPAVLDGFVTCTAALCAHRLDPAIGDYLLLSHRSKERGQQQIVERLGLQPLLAFDLQYGEGVGAVLALHQAYLATCVLRDMGMWPKKKDF
ncbi:nicotinate-nucleotide--dimethylbenzimidazole phosphoribosyltransferase [Heliobacterium gestii]|uniref:Nicotinate-nucleotide--dimethylbenzimidazole phosphoribosyltransferase n=1 Tax=Heliomicrobium gestii TaxID=2699 RepID=A0A845LFR2_HELGE|nr:nicotinate-nucleotide--dimethylbenzimidazole phosphoribosyltransferase [Heliomicrobium gestii]MBM7865431.1 nicotinate-nucleotide--dimethylbenzimidazole phosphoribosyltransferase [Heliomicrobium gestii]MZP41686.1 nicotinate-nucleotide--dimethylbenzimidazole phosphoribosyltransferase [Heliomicrobium gestii]